MCMSVPHKLVQNTFVTLRNYNPLTIIMSPLVIVIPYDSSVSVEELLVRADHVEKYKM